MSRQQQRSVRLTLEVLEDRSLPSASVGAGLQATVQHAALPSLVGDRTPGEAAFAGVGATPGQFTGSAAATGAPIHVRAGQPFRAVVSAFLYTPGIDPRLFRVAINWGDGSGWKSGYVVLDRGVYYVLGDHAYREARVYTISVVVLDPQSRPWRDWTVAVAHRALQAKDARLPQSVGPVVAAARLAAQDACFAALAYSSRREAQFVTGTLPATRSHQETASIAWTADAARDGAQGLVDRAPGAWCERVGAGG